VIPRYDGFITTDHPDEAGHGHAPTRTDSLASGSLPQRIHGADLDQARPPALGHHPGPGPTDRHGRQAARRTRSRNRFQQVSSSLPSCKVVPPATRPQAGPSPDPRLRGGGAALDLRHRRDAGTTLGTPDPPAGPLPRPVGLQQGPFGRHQRAPLDRPGSDPDPALDRSAVGLAGLERAQSHAPGQRPARPTAQDDRPVGSADDRLPQTLVAGGGLDRRWRPGPTASSSWGGPAAGVADG
jgi:hypothetical protein